MLIVANWKAYIEDVERARELLARAYSALGPGHLGDYRRSAYGRGDGAGLCGGRGLLRYSRALRAPSRRRYGCPRCREARARCGPPAHAHPVCWGARARWGRALPLVRARPAHERARPAPPQGAESGRRCLRAGLGYREGGGRRDTSGRARRNGPLYTEGPCRALARLELITHARPLRWLGRAGECAWPGRRLWHRRA